MTMPKSTQTRFLGKRDNHNHYTSLRLLFLIIITDLLMSYSRYVHDPWSVLDLHMEEMFSLSVIFIFNIMLLKKQAYRDV